MTGTEDEARAQTSEIAESMAAYFDAHFKESARSYISIQLARAYIKGKMDGMEQEHQQSMLVIHEAFSEAIPCTG